MALRLLSFHVVLLSPFRHQVNQSEPIPVIEQVFPDHQRLLVPAGWSTDMPPAHHPTVKSLGSSD